MPKKSKHPLKKRSFKSFARYSGMGIQMAVIIAAGVYGGTKLDSHFNTSQPIFTIILSLLSVFAAIYLVIKDLIGK